MRNNVIKTYSLILISASLLFAVGFAAEDDCDLAISWARVAVSTWWTYSGAITYPDVLVAYDNLYAYCCKESLFAENTDADCSVSRPVHLESPYLVDHLVDVGFRRLDVAGAYSGQIVDSWAKAWYELLHTTTWTLTPLMVQAQYKKNWSLTHVPLLQDEAGDIKDYLPLYTGFSLRDKYYNLCYVIKHAYEDILQHDQLKWTIDIWDQYSNSSFYTACMGLAKQRVWEELTFAQTIMIDRSNSALESTIQSYAIVNFVKDRLMALLDKLQSIVSLFGQIGKQAPLSKRCSQ